MESGMEKKTIKKNDIYTIEIEDLSTDGSGIGKVDGYTLFVKDALIGDTAEVKVIKTKKHYGYGRLMRIITPSPDRVEAPCRMPAAAADVRSSIYPMNGSWLSRRIRSGTC